MTRLREVGENPNYIAGPDTGFDQEGYCLRPSQAGDAGPRELQKTQNTDDKFMGVNHHSTYDHQKRVVETGEPFAVLPNGVVNMLCLGNSVYELGHVVTLSDTPGVADNTEETGTDAVDETVVGTVSETTDLSDLGGDETGLVSVQITGRV